MFQKNVKIRKIIDLCNFNKSDFINREHNLLYLL